MHIEISKRTGQMTYTTLHHQTVIKYSAMLCRDALIRPHPRFVEDTLNKMNTFNIYLSTLRSDEAIYITM